MVVEGWKTKCIKEKCCRNKAKEEEKGDSSPRNEIGMVLCCFSFFLIFFFLNSALIFRLIPSSSSGWRGSACYHSPENLTLPFVYLTSSFQHSISSAQIKLTGFQIGLHHSCTSGVFFINGHSCGSPGFVRIERFSVCFTCWLVCHVSPWIPFLHGLTPGKGNIHIYTIFIWKYRSELKVLHYASLLGENVFTTVFSVTVWFLISAIDSL